MKEIQPTQCPKCNQPLKTTNDYIGGGGHYYELTCTGCRANFTFDTYRFKLESTMKTYFVFDVESIGLHGEPFAVGYVVVNNEGKELAAKSYAVFPHQACGEESDRQWVEENIPSIPISHSSLGEMLAAFWVDWMEWKPKGSLMCADCAWPVEAKFLAMCVGLNWPQHKWNGPYPLIDIASVVLAKGGDPLADFGRQDNELPKHDPLADARQSARVLIEHLNQ